MFQHSKSRLSHPNELKCCIFINRNNDFWVITSVCCHFKILLSSCTTDKIAVFWIFRPNKWSLKFEKWHFFTEWTQFYVCLKISGFCAQFSTHFKKKAYAIESKELLLHFQSFSRWLVTFAHDKFEHFGLSFLHFRSLFTIHFNSSWRYWRPPPAVAASALLEKPYKAWL